MVLQSLSWFWWMLVRKVSTVTDPELAFHTVCQLVSLPFLDSTELSSGNLYSSSVSLLQMVRAIGNRLRSWLKTTLAPMGLDKYLIRQVEHCHSMQPHKLSTRTAGSLEDRLDILYSCFCCPTALWQLVRRPVKSIKLIQKRYHY